MGRNSQSGRLAAAASSRIVEKASVLQVARRVAATIGADFFSGVANHLSKALSADCVLVGEFIGGPMEGVRAVGAYLDSAPFNFEYELAGSASALVALGNPCLCRSDAQKRFPSDSLVALVNAQSLVAVPLLDSQNEPIGLMIALYRQPPRSLHASRQLLEIFSTRAAAELSRKREDDQLRDTEQRYRVFIARNPDAMWRIEFEHPIDTALPPEEQLAQILQFGYVAECNDALGRFFGRENAGQLLGVKLRDFEIVGDPGMRETVLPGIRAGYGFTTVEIKHVDATGRQRHFLRTYWGIVEAGKLQRIWGTTRDISDLRHSERALDASEQRMADLLETLQLVVTIVDRNGSILFCNQYFYRKTGWRSSDVIGKDWLECLALRDERGRLRGIFDAEATLPEMPIYFESTLLGPGSQRWLCEWDRAALRDAGGEIAAWANVGRDVTAHKALQMQFLQAQKLATIGRLSAGIAHDFNNLLTLILGYSTSLLEKLNPSDSMRRELVEIRKAAEKGADLTHRLLAFGRRQALHPEVLCPNTIITDTEQMLRRIIGENIRLSLNLDPGADSVKVDPCSLHQVLLNLAVNARDAMPHGGDLIIATSNVTVDGKTGVFPGVAFGQYVEINVADTGAGMTEEVRQHLFEPFFTTKESGSGVGLGLSTVYGILQQSRGHIFVETEPDRGTTFKILLPKAV